MLPLLNHNDTLNDLQREWLRQVFEGPVPPTEYMQPPPERIAFSYQLPAALAASYELPVEPAASYGPPGEYFCLPPPNLVPQPRFFTDMQVQAVELESQEPVQALRISQLEARHRRWGRGRCILCIDCRRRLRRLCSRLRRLFSVQCLCSFLMSGISTAFRALLHHH